jgi:hypothetical protein
MNKVLAMRRVIPVFATILPAALSFAMGSAAYAGPTNLVQNGGFETENTNSQYCTVQPCAQQMTTTDIANWSTTGYNFIYNAATLSGGNPNSFRTDGNSVPLWNATAPSSYTGLYSTIFSNPTGGNIAGADGAYQVGAISQTLTGMEKGGDYAVSFWFAGAQQAGYSGITTEAFSVSLGNQSFETPVLTNASHGFTGWYQETFVFEATSSSEVLSFLAIGTPSGEPPFSLLDGVSAFEVPEPATWAMLGAGMLGLCFAASRARRGASI